MDATDLKMHQLLEMVRLEKRLDGDNSKSTAAREVLKETSDEELVELSQRFAAYLVENNPYES